MKKLFYPESVAVIGVSEKPDNLAAVIVQNTLEFGYEGELHAVGLKKGEVHGIPILDSIDALPDDVDLAVILTPAKTVPGLLEKCGKKGIRWAAIETGGFAEFSEEGEDLQQQVVEVAQRYGIRFVGPNCVSVMNLDNGLCLPFVAIDRNAAKFGPVSVIAQSGGVAVSYAQLFTDAGVGVNKVISVGNKVDLDEIDYLEYLLDDPGTEVILLYLESIEEGRQLMEILSNSSKPVIVHKAFRRQASAAVAYSHTAALANDDRIVSAALKQVGAARAWGFDDAVSLGQGFLLPSVKGAEMVIASRAGGHAVASADVAADHGFELPKVSEEYLDKVKQLLRADVISLTNPLDLGAIFDFELYADVVAEGVRALEPDAMVLIQTYSAESKRKMTFNLSQRLGGIAEEMDVPVAFTLFAPREELDYFRDNSDYPVFPGIEQAMRALSASRDATANRAPLPSLGSLVRERSKEVDGILSASDDGVLPLDKSLALCDAFGIPTGGWRTVQSAEEALSAAEELGYPIVIKVISTHISHKSDVGGVVLGIETPEDLRREMDALYARLEEQCPEAEIDGVLVQPMLSGGREVIVGGKRDRSFGPLVMFGLGGIYVEVFEDVSFGLPPLSTEKAEAMIDELRGSPLLHGVRGEAPADLGSVAEALVAMSDLLVACPEVVEIDINPLLAFEETVAAVDARVVVENQTF